MASVSRAVILAAGLGTRLLPATKAIPKEMLPIIDKPLIQYAVEEAVAGGITDIVFVVAEGREAIAEHFGCTSRVEVLLRSAGNKALLEVVQAPARLARFQYVRQDRPLGIAHAVACARGLVEGEPFALLFPDDLIVGGRSCVAQLADVFEQCGGSVIATQHVRAEDVAQYGIVDPESAANPARLRGLVEKPTPESAPSDLGIVGRYILGPTIFEHIERTPPGKNGELQITDALASQIAAGEDVWAYQYEGVRYDTGRPAGLLAATLAVGLSREDLRPALLAQFSATTLGSTD